MKFLFSVIIFSTAHFFLAQYQVGHTTITFNDPARTGGFGSGGGAGRQIQTEVYYPSTTAGDNVAVASGKFPVITFGHGFAMAWDAYTNIWQHYVNRGYILAFPRTEGGLIPGPSHGDFGTDLKQVSDKMLALNTNANSIFS
jgi:predicted dienelactone hydrolase